MLSKAAMVAVTGLLLVLGGCGAPPVQPWHGTGERVAHLVTDVPDVHARQVELAAFVLRDAGAPAGTDPVAVRVVLVTDHRAWERTVRGYAERRWSTGGRQLYRLFGRACRPPGVGDPLTVFDLTAVYMGTDGADRALNRPGPAPFRMTVDDRTGQAAINSPRDTRVLCGPWGR